MKVNVKRASRTYDIPEADTVLKSGRQYCNLVQRQINYSLAGYATLACMKLLNRGTWEVLNAPFLLQKDREEGKGRNMQRKIAYIKGIQEVRSVHSTRESG